MRSWRWLVVVAMALPFVPARAEAAASCRVMTVRYAFTSGTLIALDPQHQEIAYGGCVRFSNALATSVTVSVSGGYSRTLGPDETTSTAAAFVGRSSGHQTVSAVSGPTSTTGSITVGAAPAPSRSPTTRPTTHSQHSRSHPSSTPAPAPVTSSGTGPRVAPSPGHRPRPGDRHPHSAAPTTGAIIPPPPVAPTSPPPRPAVVAGPIEPVSGRGIGLPAAVAALLLVGAAAALLRVLLAEAARVVDDAEIVGPAA